ncbi:MAG: PadR family transcriptional regulator [Acidobacteria bacterium]|nr:PadR family transcriptional regulator [Acidobacteriota bacterium]
MEALNRDVVPALPLAARDFLILLALVEGRGHGYRILQSITEESEGAVHMDPANLYRSLRRLAREGFVTEHEPDETRRRQYELTEAGVDVVAREAERLERLVSVARNKSVLPIGGSS